jgi:pimeloyl-ACP methyl ester carboxylesterase
MPSPPAPASLADAREATRWRRRVGSAAGFALAAYVGLCALMFFLQRQLMYFPTPATGDPHTTLLRSDGTPLHYAEQRRDGPQALLYFGGNAEDVTPAVHQLARAFPGHAVAGLHYRGYAGSPGQPSEAALHDDAALLLRHLRQRHPRITLIGRSLGSALAVRLAAEHEIERLLLVTPYDSIAAIAGVHYPWLPVQLLLRDRFEAWRDAPRVRAPTLLLLAEHDRVTPPAHGHALHRHFAPGVARVTTLPGTGHNSIGAHPGYLPALQR